MNAPQVIINVLLGKNLRFLRVHAGYSQRDIGKAIGVSFQQIQKYEGAQNRLSAEDVYNLARFFGVPVTRFFENFPEYQDDSYDKEIVKIVRQLKEIKDVNKRKKISDLIIYFNDQMLNYQNSNY